MEAVKDFARGRAYTKGDVMGKWEVERAKVFYAKVVSKHKNMTVTIFLKNVAIFEAMHKKKLPDEYVQTLVDLIRKDEKGDGINAHN
jgi:hypothetical protein